MRSGCVLLVMSVVLLAPPASARTETPVLHRTLNIAHGTITTDGQRRAFAALDGTASDELLDAVMAEVDDATLLSQLHTLRDARAEPVGNARLIDVNSASEAVINRDVRRGGSIKDVTDVRRLQKLLAPAPDLCDRSADAPEHDVTEDVAVMVTVNFHRVDAVASANVATGANISAQGSRTYVFVLRANSHVGS